MKHKTLIILSFLLLLYIVPLNFTMSYDASPILERQNMPKEFSQSELNETANLMDYGTDNGVYFWNKTWVIDGSYWNCFSSQTWYGYFHDLAGIGFNYSIYAKTDVLYSYVDFYNYETLTYTSTVSITTTSRAWYNGTLGSEYVNSTGWVDVRFTTNPFDTGRIDYFQLNFMYLDEWHEVGIAQLWFDMPDWHIIATAILIFWTAVDERLVNWLLVFLGLIMIPASTLYLVKGGKDSMSANKFFYFCVAFMLGWGLLLGGIM